MSIVQYTEQEQRLTNTLRLTTEALRAVTAERDAQRKVLERINAQEPAAWFNAKMDMTYMSNFNKDDIPLFLAAGAQPVPSSKYPCQLTDAELADPEYMRSYIEAMNQDYADLLYAQLVQAQERKPLKASEIVTMYAEQP